MMRRTMIIYFTIIVSFLQLHSFIYGYRTIHPFHQHYFTEKSQGGKNRRLSLSDSNQLDFDRKNRWKQISNYEKKAVELIGQSPGNVEEAILLFAKSLQLKNQDPFMVLLQQYSQAIERKDQVEADKLLVAMKSIGFPPHIQSLIKAPDATAPAVLPPVTVVEEDDDEDYQVEEVDPSSNFSDTVTENIRVKVTSFYDMGKSDPKTGKYMFWYKVAIYNEGNEPVQIVSRTWEIENYKGEKETVRGAGIMQTQPIIPAGELFTYQSTCPLKIFPPKGKRVLGTLSGTYTMCRGNTGQYTFAAKVSKFNLILPDPRPST